jgi:hypothetical protein
MSWQELAAKRIERLDGSSRPYFRRDEILRAVQVVEAVAELAKESPSPESPSPTSSAQ